MTAWLWSEPVIAPSQSSHLHRYGRLQVRCGSRRAAMQCRSQESCSLLSGALPRRHRLLECARLRFALSSTRDNSVCSLKGERRAPMSACCGFVLMGGCERASARRNLASMVEKTDRLGVGSPSACAVDDRSTLWPIAATPNGVTNNPAVNHHESSEAQSFASRLLSTYEVVCSRLQPLC